MLRLPDVRARDCDTLAGMKWEQANACQDYLMSKPTLFCCLALYGLRFPASNFIQQQSEKPTGPETSQDSLVNTLTYTGDS